MDDATIQGFLNSFDDSRYPLGFLAKYEALECFSHSPAGETLLVKDRETGKHFVAKCYFDKALLSHATESDLLKKLHHGGLPAFIGEYENESMLCVVREYVAGIPLEQYVAQNELTQTQVVCLGTQLCDILAYLHGQTPPVIHRDIKPQNIIVDEEGTLRLIDFGISRLYDDAAQEDTVCFGTRQFAAPEQYGFSQTDGRSDIFSVGVLLCWLLTGETKIRTAVPKIENSRMRSAVAKCTAFAPERRFVSAEKLKAALITAGRRSQKRAQRWIVGLVVCATCLGVSVVAGRYTNYWPVHMGIPRVSFQEPLIEQAVRLALNKEINDPITADELLRVTELHIFGHRAAANMDEYVAIGAHMAQNDGLLTNGGLRSLHDLTMLKNLRLLSIALQDIKDLTPLGQLSSLERIELKHNPIEDVTPLSLLPLLQELCLYDTRTTDLSALASCPLLSNINAGKTQITSMTAFAGIANLKHLHMQQTALANLSGLEGFCHLEEIGLSSVANGDLSPLLALPKLKEVHLDESLRDSAQTQLKQAQFDIVYCDLSTR